MDLNNQALFLDYHLRLIILMSMICLLLRSFIGGILFIIRREILILVVVCSFKIFSLLFLVDYVLRSEVLHTNLVKDIKYMRSMAYYNPDYSDYFNDALKELRDENPSYFDTACQIIKSDFDRNTRLKRRIEKLMKKGDCVFLTLTFRDDVLDSTEEVTRRKYVTRFLKSCSGEYVGNIDFGTLTDREHYHAIVHGRVQLDKWEYGFAYAKKVIMSSNPLILAKYISKLTNHAVKDSARRNHLIYSRKKEADRFSS